MLGREVCFTEILRCGPEDFFIMSIFHLHKGYLFTLITCSWRKETSLLASAEVLDLYMMEPLITCFLPCLKYILAFLFPFLPRTQDNEWTSGPSCKKCLVLPSWMISLSLPLLKSQNQNSFLFSLSTCKRFIFLFSWSNNSQKLT